MDTLARILRQYAIVLWVGGIFFFAVLAPIPFRVLTSRDTAGLIIGAALHSLHTIGLICGVLILLALRILNTRTRFLRTQLALAVLMLVLTFISNRYILVPMEQERELAGGHITALLADSPLRKDFDTRHAWSTRVEVTILLAGIALATLIAIDRDKRGESI